MRGGGEVEVASSSYGLDSDSSLVFLSICLFQTKIYISYTFGHSGCDCTNCIISGETFHCYLYVNLVLLTEPLVSHDVSTGSTGKVSEHNRRHHWEDNSSVLTLQLLMGIVQQLTSQFSHLVLFPPSTQPNHSIQPGPLRLFYFSLLFSASFLTTGGLLSLGQLGIA